MEKAKIINDIFIYDTYKIRIKSIDCIETATYYKSTNTYHIFLYISGKKLELVLDADEYHLLNKAFK